MPKHPYPSWQRRHDGVLIYLLQRPWVKLPDCARETDYSASQVSRITCAPEFRRRYSETLEERRSAALAKRFNHD